MYIIVFGSISRRHLIYFFYIHLSMNHPAHLSIQEIRHTTQNHKHVVLCGSSSNSAEGQFFSFFSQLCVCYENTSSACPTSRLQNQISSVIVELKTSFFRRHFVMSFSSRLSFEVSTNRRKNTQTTRLQAEQHIMYATTGSVGRAM